jgi:hypothetical protein
MSNSVGSDRHFKKTKQNRKERECISAYVCILMCANLTEVALLISEELVE